MLKQTPEDDKEDICEYVQGVQEKLEEAHVAQCQRVFFFVVFFALCPMAVSRVAL